MQIGLQLQLADPVPLFIALTSGPLAHIPSVRMRGDLSLAARLLGCGRLLRSLSRPIAIALGVLVS